MAFARFKHNNIVPVLIADVEALPTSHVTYWTLQHPIQQQQQISPIQLTQLKRCRVGGRRYSLSRKQTQAIYT